LVELPIVVKEMTDIEIPIKIGTAGRAQIPQEIREKLMIEEGDYLLIKIEKVIKGKQDGKEAA
jgi:AbrB family looped-hinge helix DNA binding protein